MTRQAISPRLAMRILENISDRTVAIPIVRRAVRPMTEWHARRHRFPPRLPRRDEVGFFRERHTTFSELAPDRSRTPAVRGRHPLPRRRHVVAQQAQHVGGAFDHVGARAVDALHPGALEEVVVLRRDHAAGDDLDIGAAGVAQVPDQFGDQRLVAGRKRAGADRVDVLGPAPCRAVSSGVWNSGPEMTSKPMSAKAQAITLAPRSCPSWPILATMMRGLRPSRRGDRLHAFDHLRVARVAFIGAGRRCPSPASARCRSGRTRLPSPPRSRPASRRARARFDGQREQVARLAPFGSRCDACSAPFDAACAGSGWPPRRALQRACSLLVALGAPCDARDLAFADLVVVDVERVDRRRPRRARYLLTPTITSSPRSTPRLLGGGGFLDLRLGMPLATASVMPPSCVDLARSACAPPRPASRSAPRRNSEPPSGSTTLVMPLSSCSTSWVLRAMRAEKSVGSASASSSALVCSDCVPPSTAASASTVVRMTLL